MAEVVTSSSINNTRIRNRSVQRRPREADKRIQFAAHSSDRRRRIERLITLTLRERGRKPLLVAADLQRPAAIDQLKVLGEQINVPVYSEYPGSPVNAFEPTSVLRKCSSLNGSFFHAASSAFDGDFTC